MPQGPGILAGPNRGRHRTRDPLEVISGEIARIRLFLDLEPYPAGTAEAGFDDALHIDHAALSVLNQVRCAASSGAHRLTDGNLNVETVHDAVAIQVATEECHRCGL